MAVTRGLQLLCLLLFAGAEMAVATVHKVGEGAGWTVGAPNVNYKTWAASKTFLLGDTILFEYNKQFHNVLQVKQADYRACNTSSPIATYASGKDSVPVKRRGHYFFICGVPGHCDGGQKVDIRVVVAAAASAPSGPPVSSPSPVSTPLGAAPPLLSPPAVPSRASPAASSVGFIVAEAALVGILLLL